MAIPAGQAEAAAILGQVSGASPLETHISAVFRGTDTVWKMKKAVRLGFLDFTDIHERRRLLERELALNAPHVPGLYKGVVPVLRGEVVLDWALRMARVPEGDFLDTLAAAGGIGPALLTALADAVAAMHGAQAAAAGDPAMVDQAGRMRAVAEGNARAAGDAGLDAEAVAGWRFDVLRAIDGIAPLLEARRGLVRRAHGDLHLGNMLMWHGRPAPFDALEFNEELATIDPGYDLAFLLMDLEQRVSRAAANAVLNRYVARTGDAGLVGALAPFLSLRAMVRAHVEASRGRDGTGLLAAALGYLHPGRPVVLAVGGLMGTGKSTLARALAPGMGGAPGALVLRSDEVRKRVHGVAPEERLGQEGYTATANARTDAALMEELRAAAGRHAVIVDATFLGAGLGAGFAGAVERTARAAGAPFLGVWLDAPLPELERRVAARQGDASDAGVSVLRQAVGAARVPAGWTLVDALDLGRAEAQVQLRLAVL